MPTPVTEARSTTTESVPAIISGIQDSGATGISSDEADEARENRSPRRTAEKRH